MKFIANRPEGLLGLDDGGTLDSPNKCNRRTGKFELAGGFETRPRHLSKGLNPASPMVAGGSRTHINGGLPTESVEPRPVVLPLNYGHYPCC